MTDATLPPGANKSQIDKGSEKTTECDRSRFWIALALVVGMLIILVISVAQAQYTQTEQLAAIFSGWITSIAAFYFLRSKQRSSSGSNQNIGSISSQF